MPSALASFTLLATALLLPFDFASADTVPQASLSLWSAGGRLPEALLRDVFLAYRFIRSNVSISYMTTTATSAVCRLNNPTNHCSPSDSSPPHTLDFVALSGPPALEAYAQCPDLQLYPAVGYAVVPIFNLGSTVTDLVLSAQTLAQIFSGQILTWDDHRIQKDNPSFASWGIPANQPIEVVVRAETCGLVAVFKRALASFDPVFAGTMDLTGDPVWPTVNTTVAHGTVGVTSYVMVTPYTIGFAEAGDAVSCCVLTAKLLHGGHAVEASGARMDYSMMEVGVLFGNDDEDPSRLTATFQAVGNNTWPITGFIYVGIRKATDVPCQQVEETMAFWQWFWTSEVAQRLTRRHAMGSLPEAVRRNVWSLFAANMTCGGQPVAVPDRRVSLVGYGPPSVAELLPTLFDIYQPTDAEVDLTYTSLTAPQVEGAVPHLGPMAFWVSEQRSALPDQLSLPFLGVGVVAISRYNVTLDLDTLARILDGDIATWLHPDILALNPDGIWDTAGVAITDPRQRIVLLQGPEEPLAMLDDLLQPSSQGYSGAAIRLAPRYATDRAVRTAVLGIPCSLAVTTFSAGLSPLLQTASWRRPDGAVVSPSWQAIQACAGDTASGPIDSSYRLESSASPDCYPLARALFLTVRAERCPPAAAPAARPPAVRFVDWLFSEAEVAVAAAQENMAPLMGAAPALTAIACIPRPDATGGGPSGVSNIVAAAVAAGVIVLLAVVALCWHYSRRSRQVRRQSSNDLVAQECAAAIARFDLDAVAWLKDLQHPTCIQTSFLRIVKLLDEVKPFIPDLLLESLFRQEPLRPEKEEGPEEDRRSTLSATRKFGSPFRKCDSVGYLSSCRQSSSDLNTMSFHRRCQPLVSSSPKSCVTNVVSLESCSPRHEVLHQRWMRKKCAFLYGLVGTKANLEDPTTLSDMSFLVASLVRIAKRHGATIERVGADIVVVHWGLSAAVAEAATCAAAAAMEMAAAGQEAAAALQTALTLRVGVGYGPCQVATLSAAGHRFIVSVGQELRLASRIAHTDIATRCKCIVLMSDSVQQEVRYGVKCFPRAWLQDVLLWEPLELLPPVPPDEWMYELAQLDQSGDHQALQTALLDVFRAVPTAPSQEAVRQAVLQLKEQYSDDLTVQDRASLDNLLAALASPVAVVAES